MTQRTLRVIDCLYTGREHVAAAFLLREGDRAAIIETNANPAVPIILKAVEEEGLTPEQVDWIIITHVHLDHAGGASALMEACPNATLLAHPKAAPHVIDPARLVKSAKDIYGEETFAKLYGEIKPVPEARVRIMEDDEVLPFGERNLRFFYTRGHANHHFCVYDDILDTVFAGDNFGIVYPDLQTNGTFAFPSTPPTDFDAQAALESIDRILETGAKSVYPTHFGEVTDIKAVASQLQDHLKLYQQWVDDIYESEKPDEELDDFFTNQLKIHLEKHLDDIGIDIDDPRCTLLSIDIMLNGQGLAFAVKKRRFKARKAAQAK